MGAWGVGAFENDEALDFVGELLETRGDNQEIINVLRGIFERTDTDGYLEAPECERTVAGAEIIAAAGGQPQQNLPRELNGWLHERQPTFTRTAIELALKAIRRVSTESELKDLWEETPQYDQWAATIGALESRLANLL